MSDISQLFSQISSHYGLQPGELQAIWAQESSRSMDPTLLGQPTRHGRAVGPFQIMPKFWGPVPTSFEGQANLAGKILAQGGSTPDERARSYYGRGNAGPGQPTTDQYAAQVAARRGDMPLTNQLPAAPFQAPTASFQTPQAAQDIQAQQQALLAAQQRQAYAQQLMRQYAQQGALQGQMVSGHYVAPSWTQQLASALRPIMGQYQMNQAQKAVADAQKGLAGAQQRANQSRTAALASALTGSGAPQQSFSARQGALSEQGRRLALYGQQNGDAATMKQGIAMMGQAASMAPPAQPQEPLSWREYQLAKGQGYPGGYQDFLTMKPKAGATNINVNNGLKGAQAYAVERQKQSAKQFDAMQTGAETARAQNQALARIIENSGSASKGGLADLQNSMQNFLSSFGYKSDQLTSDTLITQAVNDILEHQMGALGARGLTDQDMKILKNALPQLSSEPGARVAVANILMKNNNNEIAAFKNRVGWEKQNYPEQKLYYPGWLDSWKPASATAPATTGGASSRRSALPMSNGKIVRGSLQQGVTYDTPGGPATWNGTQFVPAGAR